MNWKNRLTNYNFWISIFSAVLLILQALKIEFDIAYVNEIFTAVLGLLVVIGIICDPTRTSVKSTEVTNKVKTDKLENKQEQTDKTLPIDKENETCNINIKNDMQTILEKITTDLDNKIKELEKFNLNSLTQINDQKTSIIEKDLSQKEEVVEPAVAENNNHYIDVIN